MNDSATSLDTLNDVILPSAVPWWPLAPGWYGILGVLFLAIIWQICRLWQRWQANAYRRAALHELSGLEDAVAIAELLRRTALAIVPRKVVAELTGTTWTDWLAAGYNEAMPPNVRQLLAVGIYGLGATEQEIHILRTYAAAWIVHHRLPLNS
ncbi:MAG: DUF4381 domain-containing protein [Methylococcaceae bacterium]|nr:DUF4381 domain-containing protein [Methylococcaceae bacterium]